MASFSIVGLFAVVVAGLILGGLVAGITLLIIGLARRRRGLWIGGLVATIISAAILLGVGALAALIMAR